MKNPERVAALIAEFKSLAENDFEQHRIEGLERDLESPPVVEVIDDTHQNFDGVVYRTDKKKHYRVNCSLHRAVYSYYYGEIPIGYDIHHIDWNTENNDISNLQLVTKQEHASIHHANISYAKPLTEKFCKACGKKIDALNNGRNKFCSDYCRTRYNYVASFENRTCAICGKEFRCSRHSQTLTCSVICSTKLQAQNHTPVSKIEERVCEICGKNFTVNKNKKTVTCSKSCSTKLQWSRRKNYPKIEVK